MLSSKLIEAFYYVEVPVRDLNGNKNDICKMRVPMILPHELLNYLIVSLARNRSGFICFVNLGHHSFMSQYFVIYLQEYSTDLWFIWFIL